ncbi:MAG TPA: hypothetical protein PK720_04090 [bacterium]|jgi:hypothetical protein|nr:hypothetical protein [bacterium]
MINQQDKNIVLVYALTVVVAGILVVVIMNFNGWFFSDDNTSPSEFTPAGRDTVGKKDIDTTLFIDEKFRSLGPLLSPQEIKRLEDIENQPVDSQDIEVPTGAVRPKREVRHSNPFIPFK